MKYFISPIIYGEPGWNSGELFSKILKKHNLLVVEGGTALKRKDFLLYQADYDQLMTVPATERKELLQEKALVVGKMKNIEKYLLDYVRKK